MAETFPWLFARPCFQQAAALNTDDQSDVLMDGKITDRRTKKENFFVDGENLCFMKIDFGFQICQHSSDERKDVLYSFVGRTMKGEKKY